MRKPDSQQAVCERYQASYMESPPYLKVGISESVRKGVRPIHGLRLEPAENTTGWYIWSGDYLEESDFFVSLHVAHLPDWQSQLSQYLGLSPGWRFLINPEEDYEDVWYDPNLLIEANR
jgi:hypothetical protein